MKALVLAAALFAAAAAPAQAKTENLYHPGKATFYAFVDKPVAAHAQAKASARTVGRLKTRTPDKTDELVLVLASTTDKLDRTWYQVRMPIRPNGTKGWVPADALSELQPLDTWLKINTRAFTATLIKKGKKVFSARVGVGQPQWATPKGQFYVRSKLTGYGSAGS